MRSNEEQTSPVRQSKVRFRSSFGLPTVTATPAVTLSFKRKSSKLSITPVLLALSSSTLAWCQLGIRNFRAAGCAPRERTFTGSKSPKGVWRQFRLLPVPLRKRLVEGVVSRRGPVGRSSLLPALAYWDWLFICLGKDGVDQGNEPRSCCDGDQRR